MEFALSEEQRLFDDSLRGFLADRLPMKRCARLPNPAAVSMQSFGAA